MGGSVCKLSYFTVVQFRLEFLRLLNLSGRFHKIFIYYIISALSNSKHSTLSAHVPHVRPIEILANFTQWLKVYISMSRNWLRMDL